MKLSDIPDEIVCDYNLRAKETPDGSVYIEINKGMYGLPQAGLLANELLEKRLNKRAGTTRVNWYQDFGHMKLAIFSLLS